MHLDRDRVIKPPGRSSAAPLDGKPEGCKNVITPQLASGNRNSVEIMALDHANYSIYPYSEELANAY